MVSFEKFGVNQRFPEKGNERKLLIERGSFVIFFKEVWQRTFCRFFPRHFSIPFDKGGTDYVDSQNQYDGPQCQI
ncbi:hypothetical protein ANT_17230 [Anaerolinea thermophila UNI-1]|uniref:Uncharacterized protein n=1 Tax=Anaerolinea thermophila (strain DSM 14523 / JCM 11388 / NBRC 100420 / UNI-1) TaxID=926569 RepID=E8N5N5_ANATU|nr:hypothetical protein ANT_17230 [Anaerolinea thermophila UNI-1]